MLPTEDMRHFASAKHTYTYADNDNNLAMLEIGWDRHWGLVVRVLGYTSGGPGSIPSTTRKKVVGLERGPFSLVSTNEELLDRKVAAPV
jgi:hypothetical protein